MRKVFLLGTAVLALTAGAQAAFFDNFDSYANQAAFNAVWTPGTAAMTLDTDGSPAPQSSPNTIAQGLDAAAAFRNLGADSVQLRNVDFSFDFYDGGAALGRTYALLESRGSSPTASRSEGLNQIIAIGKYNGTATTKYSGRIAIGSINWFNLDAPTSPDRSVGWHTMRIVGDGAPAPTLTFYVDGKIGKQVTLTQAQGDVLMNWVQVGSNLTSATTANFDNVSVTPEPAPLGFLALAGLAMLRRRRA